MNKLFLAVLIPLACLTATSANELPTAPDKALAELVAEKGVRIELVAAEPMVSDPVAISWDAAGRLFVAENRGYPEGPETGVIAMLEDSDNDGRMDKRTEFATGLAYPNGLTPWRGGFFVTCAPDIYYLKDTDNDGRADVRKVVLSGYMTNSTTQLRVAHPTLGLDGWIHVTAGLTGGKVISPEHPDRAPVEFKKSDSRFNPDTYEIEEYPGVGQFGLCFDDYGNKFNCSNRNPLKHVVLHPKYLHRNPHFAFSKFEQDVAPSGEQAFCWPLSEDATTAGFHPKLMATPHAGTFTSACGISIYRGTTLPPNYYGSAILCEPAQNLVQRQILTPSGATFAGNPATPGRELIASKDSWFRPVFSANGPDGALYLCDMYRKILDHPRYLPEHIRDQLDYAAGRNMGRIYRLTKRANKLKSTDLDQAAPADLIRNLDHPDAWQRETAFRLLSERGLYANLTQMKRPAARVAAAALTRNQSKLGNDSSPEVRAFAVQLAETRTRTPGVSSSIASLANDPASRVRFRVALAMAGAPGASRELALAKLATGIGDDDWSAAAIMSSLDADSTGYVARHLLSTGDAARASALMEPLGKAAGRVAGDAEAANLVRLLSRNQSPAAIDWQTAFVDGFLSGLRTRGLGKGKSVIADLAARSKSDIDLNWLFKLSENVAGNPKAPEASRVAAIAFLAHGESSTAPLRKLISPDQPHAIQAAAIATLGKLGDAETGNWLVESVRWKSFSPAVQGAVVGAFLGHSKLIPLLITAIEDERIPAWVVPEPRRRGLMVHRDKDLKARAVKLFSAMGGSDRQAAYEKLKPLTAKTGNASDGKVVFERTCAACHKYNGTGHQVGPDLSGVRNQPKDAILLHIIVPNAEIYPGFTAYEVETKDDRSLTGILTSENESSVTLRAAQGIEETFLRRDIARLAAGNHSLMPNELEKTMTEPELVNLLEFLKGN
jgi:putative membrane-bound dehydrogenase-like protein